MSTLTTRRSRAIEYTIVACVAAVIMVGIVHLMRHSVAVQRRVEAIGAGCRPLVVAQASRLAQQHPGLTWSIERMQVLGDIETDQPDQNICAVAMRFDVNGQVDRESWEVQALGGTFVLRSARLAGVETRE